MPKYTTLQETIYFEPLQEDQIDLEQHLIRGVKILGLTSKNNREYTRDALKRAIPLFEGKCVNVDHSEPGTRQRSYKDRFGSLLNVNLREDGLYGDLRYNPKHSLAEQFLWDAQNAPHNVGLSQDAQGTVVVKGKRRLVEHIERVKSVDLVADPASVTGLFESVEGTSDMNLAELTLEELRSSRPDLLESFQESLNQTEASQRREREFQQLREQLAALQAEKALTLKRETVLAELKEANLDPTNATEVSPAFLDILIKAEESDRKTLIAERKAWKVPNLQESQGVQSGSRFVVPAAGRTFVGETRGERVKAWSH